VFNLGLVSTVDLAPTILELAGATPPETMQGRSFRSMLKDPGSYSGRTHVFSERNWHDCDEHQRAVRTARFKLIRTDAYTELPLCTAADIGASPSFLALRARAKAHLLTAAQSRLFESPRARVELYDLTRDPWELRNVADDPRYAKQVRELARVLQEWMEQTDDFPAAYRVRDDNTDRITGVPFSTKIPPLRNTDLPHRLSGGAGRVRHKRSSPARNLLPPRAPEPSPALKPHTRTYPWAASLALSRNARTFRQSVRRPPGGSVLP
jgi:N-sulfoglucosamine sulfohydrolase